MQTSGIASSSPSCSQFRVECLCAINRNIFKIVVLNPFFSVFFVSLYESFIFDLILLAIFVSVSRLSYPAHCSGVDNVSSHNKSRAQLRMVMNNEKLNKVLREQQTCVSRCKAGVEVPRHSQKQKISFYQNSSKVFHVCCDTFLFSRFGTRLFFSCHARKLLQLCRDWLRRIYVWQPKFGENDKNSRPDYRKKR